MRTNTEQFGRKLTLHGIHFNLIEVQRSTFTCEGGTQRHVKKDDLDIVNSSIQSWKSTREAYEVEQSMCHVWILLHVTHTTHGEYL
jgi:hypothetical protein